MVTLAKGLAVIRAFGAERPPAPYAVAGRHCGRTFKSDSSPNSVDIGWSRLCRTGRTRLSLTSNEWNSVFLIWPRKVGSIVFCRCCRPSARMSPRLALRRCCMEVTLSMSLECRLLGL